VKFLIAGIGLKTNKCTHALAYQPTSSRLWNWSVILGIAVAISMNFQVPALNWETDLLWYCPLQIIG
jgi:hypothetical protein